MKVSRMHACGLAVLLAASLGLAGCGGGGSGSTPDPSTGSNWDEMNWDDGQWAALSSGKADTRPV